MTNLVRRDPFAMDEWFDDLLKGYLVRPVGLSGEMPAARMIRMDMKEDEGGYTVHAEMPGVKKEDIQIAIEGNTVSITAESKGEKEVKEGEKVLRSERYHGRVQRSFSLGQEVDDTGAKARFENGVLELVLPKKTITPPRTLMIQ